MSIPTGIDGDAPVRAHHETDISVPLDRVLAAARRRQRVACLADRYHRGASRWGVPALIQATAAGS